MNLGMSGKNILITGAGKGMGREMAISAAREGANIAVHFHTSKDKALETVGILRDIGVAVHPFQADISQIDEIQRMKNEIHAQLGHIDYIVNNAGWAQMKSFFQYEPDEWRKEIDICFYGVLNIIHTFMPDMIKNQAGKFINIIGDSARTGDRKLIMSAAARNGTVSFLKSLAREVGESNIQCNTVSLGMVDQGGLGEDLIHKIRKQYPLKRLGNPEDVTGMVLFLLSEQADWITGQVFSVNGGHSMIG
ncbi:SDR family NAD(P)-dependent oxidoreductase [Cytobacillus purgationiresistens]|uniref:NAD(P)-dependent dehydrogenase (Short-subunit alcohol dehydrogenase family) n=1 Tax=Cytobacillus purgationiresistens TaxID=863449 RepID=A0ABU0AF19_9BACI|nr:SDR family oxidoreductase [Cytobacillus purgationiresistens]MDQ0269845.1 NAD(P)-dependent dehydrogenase (short-subunit alcohol dehydrogenase family) [Cytobacillus purgationiresistens]